MLRGRIVKLNGQIADATRAQPSAAWALRGDRGITFAASVPEGSSLVKGEWWPKDYSGPPLISLESEIADGLGLTIGDEITVNVLGRNVTGKIANTRKVNWRSFGINFVLVFSPNSFAGAPFNDLATLTFPAEGNSARTSAQELALLTRDGADFSRHYDHSREGRARIRQHDCWATRYRGARRVERRAGSPPSWFWAGRLRPASSPASTTPSCSKRLGRRGRGCLRLSL